MYSKQFKLCASHHPAALCKVGMLLLFSVHRRYLCMNPIVMSFLMIVNIFSQLFFNDYGRFIIPDSGIPVLYKAHHLIVARVAERPDQARVCAAVLCRNFPTF
jgi:hypothetical protein